MMGQEAQELVSGRGRDGAIDAAGHGPGLPGVLQALPIAIVLSALLWVVGLALAIAEYSYG